MMKLFRKNKKKSDLETLEKKIRGRRAKDLEPHLKFFF